jgi:aminoglycoside/choline kinase family phosphotransferase
MQEIIHQITVLCNKIGIAVDSIDILPASGSDRRYFRIHSNKENYIATYNTNIPENKTFIAFSNHFASKQIPVPKQLISSEDGLIYIQEDLGQQSLLDKIEELGGTEATFVLFQKTLSALARLQILGHEGLDYNLCLTSKEFDKQTIFTDLLYFKYYFLRTLKLQYDKQQLFDDFDALSTYLTHTDVNYFMMRDCQSRNVMVKDEEIYFIDYQGGMQGALHYDVASLLWQAKANLSPEWKDKLLDYYIDEINQLVPKPVDKTVFIGQYNGYVLIRLLQVLGAYGFRGLFERKAHFLTSIPLALKNLQWFVKNKRIGISLKELNRVLDLITEDEIIDRFQNIKADKNSSLIVSINSFSFLKRGYPTDVTGNGGGFVFDCRAIHNPGRFEQYKLLTGRDKPVKDFLEQQTKMSDFLNNVYNLVDLSVEDYLKRGFENLSINFGCTGGQHRSVYAAEETARHLRNKYGLKITLNHLEQGISTSYNIEK